MARFEPTPGRASLVARIEGSDPTAPSLCLMGHTDVVPVNEAGWTHDPFAWNPGDGSPPLNCPNGGTPWEKWMSENQTVCSHTYTKSTAGQPNDALNIEASITWDLTWNVNNTPQGTFDTYTNTTTLSHQVGEIQAVLIPNNEPLNN